MSAVAGSRRMRLFLCGDLMTGRGIDQILAHPGNPRLHEPYVHSAQEYVHLAERATGPIQRGVSSTYVWGDVLRELEAARPDARIVNLETAVTRGGEPWPRKGIHYRMHPANVGCLAIAGLDCCVLANNHVLDWGYDGLRETLRTLAETGIGVAGAGLDESSAREPAIIEPGSGSRVLVYGYGSPSSGVPEAWAATRRRPGINVLDETDPRSVGEVARAVGAVRRPGDVVIASLHWGGNWGYEITPEQRRTARGLIDEAGVDLVHGHSSHHPRGIEVYRGKTILYGCGDFLNDYEGIGGYEAFRPDLGLMYLPEVDPATGRLHRLGLVPTRIEHFRVRLADQGERSWLLQQWNRIQSAAASSARLVTSPEGCFELAWE